MPDRSNKRKKGRADAIPLAAPFVDQTSGDTLFEQPLVDEQENAAAVAPGRSGGLKGGKARATKLGKAKLSAIAKKADAIAAGRKNAEFVERHSRPEIVPLFARVHVGTGFYHRRSPI